MVEGDENTNKAFIGEACPGSAFFVALERCFAVSEASCQPTFDRT